MKKTKLIYMLCSMFLLNFMVSCDDDDTIEEAVLPIASFTADILDETKFLEVTFTNVSQNATSYSWDFGDETGTSTEENPVYSYSEAGTFMVVLTATDDSGESDDFELEVTVTDPDAQLTLLTGTESKTWKLYAEDDSTSMWKTGEGAWTGLKNDGSRPCLYYQTITFERDLDYIFDDAGSFWGEYGPFGVWDNQGPLYETCFEATAENMVNMDGADVSAWLSGTHTYEYNVVDGELTLTGDGAWIGIPKLATTEESNTPSATVTCNITIDDSNEAYDLMTVVFNYAASTWTIRYASYHDEADEPTILDEPVVVVIPDLTLDTFSHSFASEDGAVSLDSISGGSSITLGATDPDGGSTAVGEFYRSTAQFQEAKLQLTQDGDVYDIGFDNLTTISVEVYFPSTNDYTGDLTQGILIGLANEYGNSGNWWEDVYNYESAADLALDTWHTLEFTISEAGNRDDDPTDRDDLDLIYIQMGGGGHTAEGTFFIRNLVFE